MFRGHVDDFHLPSTGPVDDLFDRPGGGLFESGSLADGYSHPPGGQTVDGRYRVRRRLSGERTVPQHLNVPRFGRLEEAERCARQQAEQSDQILVVEKLAPAGCWLELFTVGSLLAA